MAISPSELRQNIYRLLDEVLETGTPLEVERKGRRLRITVVEAPSRLARLTPHPDFVIGDAGDLVHMDWSQDWRP